MGISDPSGKDNAVVLQPQPGEGTDLPTYYELHRKELVIGVEVLGVIAFAVAAFMGRSYLRRGLIVSAAMILALKRRCAAKIHSVRSEIDDQASRF